ncbi:MAG: 50S ribosomal protein L24e [Candidatus Diapherotrites archaeon]|nr:50S ribosomal protein L24e [Candidatus Diapherotrites archaeon]
MQCSFCGIQIPRGTGKIFVRKTGQTFFFCSNKCEKNLLKLGRSPRNVKWTLEFRKAKELERAVQQKKTAKAGKESGKKENATKTMAR